MDGRSWHGASSPTAGSSSIRPTLPVRDAHQTGVDRRGCQSEVPVGILPLWNAVQRTAKDRGMGNRLGQLEDLQDLPTEADASSLAGAVQVSSTSIRTD